jgi:hypothetical protein
MIIVVPSCLKDADGARTRSDQNPSTRVYDEDNKFLVDMSSYTTMNFKLFDVVQTYCTLAYQIQNH